MKILFFQTKKVGEKAKTKEKTRRKEEKKLRKCDKEKVVSNFQCAAKWIHCPHFCPHLCPPFSITKDHKKGGKKKTGKTWWK